MENMIQILHSMESNINDDLQCPYALLSVKNRRK